MVEDIGSRERCWRGGCRGRLRYGKEDEWRGGDGMVVRIRFLRKIKREGEGDEDRGGGGDGELGAWGCWFGSAVVVVVSSVVVVAG